MAISGAYAAVGAYKDDDGGTSSGSVYMFERAGDSWTQVAKLVAADEASFDQFGHAVAISGNYTVVGAPYDDYGAGDDLRLNQHLWRGVATFDLNTGDAGSAYVFERIDGEWTQKAKLTADDYGLSDYFGYAVAISGNYAVITSREDDDGGTSSGSAYVFERIDGTWTQAAKLVADDAAQWDYFGSAVAIDGDYAVVGSPLDDDGGTNSGAAYVFERIDGTWTQAAKLVAAGLAGDGFGLAVGISGAYAVVGAYTDDNDCTYECNYGSAFVFERSGASPSWSQVAKLVANDAAPNDYFGGSVAIDADLVVVGAYNDDDACEDSDSCIDTGSAYVFGRESDGSWTQQFKLTAVDIAAGDEFGYAVAISGGHVVVGAYLDDDAGSYESGSAYLFANHPPQPTPTPSTTAPTLAPALAPAPTLAPSTTAPTEAAALFQHDKLVADDGAAGDRFGDAVAISGDYAVVGAYYDDDAGTSSGSAYVFGRDSGGTWSQVAKLVADDAATDDEFGYAVAISGDYAVVGSVEIKLVTQLGQGFPNGHLTGLRTTGSYRPNGKPKRPSTPTTRDPTVDTRPSSPNEALPPGWVGVGHEGTRGLLTAGRVRGSCARFSNFQ